MGVRSPWRWTTCVETSSSSRAPRRRRASRRRGRGGGVGACVRALQRHAWPRSRAGARAPARATRRELGRSPASCTRRDAASRRRGRRAGGVGRRPPHQDRHRRHPRGKREKEGPLEAEGRGQRARRLRAVQGGDHRDVAGHERRRGGGGARRRAARGRGGARRAARRVQPAADGRAPPRQRPAEPADRAARGGDPRAAAAAARGGDGARLRVVPGAPRPHASPANSARARTVRTARSPLPPLPRPPQVQRRVFTDTPPIERYQEKLVARDDLDDGG